MKINQVKHLWFYSWLTNNFDDVFGMSDFLPYKFNIRFSNGFVLLLKHAKCIFQGLS